ncbi:MAG: tetratricopeptide repeat protein [Xanthomonadales bacterium]|nr:tetratricopeptide repeat protein [Xanthomonadales bacterium]
MNWHPQNSEDDDSELEWVQFTEHGTDQINRGQLAAAEDSWQRASDIAQRFTQGDARRAASLNNLAVVARLAQRLDDADRLYQQALQEWDLAHAWIERMEKPLRAYSSLFHLQLEAKHRAHYARLALDEYFKQLPRGAAVTQNNRAEWLQHNGTWERAKSLYREALEQYEATFDAPAQGAEAMRRNLVVCEDAESREGRVNTPCVVWTPALEQGFVAHAKCERWIIDLPPVFTDEGRFMAGLMCTCLIERMPPMVS